MSTIELKRKLIEKINSIENVELLQEASRLIDIETSELEKPYILSDDMEHSISEAKEQIINKEYSNHSKANEEIEKWFGE